MKTILCLYRLSQRATHPVKGQQGSKKPTGPADWKRDKNLRDWAVGVDKRVMTEQSKKLRAANKVGSDTRVSRLVKTHTHTLLLVFLVAIRVC